MFVLEMLVLKVWKVFCLFSIDCLFVGDMDLDVIFVNSLK